MKRSLAIAGRLGIILATCLLTGAIIWVIYWWPVIDTLIHWCERYPATFADCRE